MSNISTAAEFKSLTDVRKEIKDAKKQLRTWRAAGEYFGITGGLAYKIAVDGYEPRDNKIREMLGLQQVCPKCGRPL